MAIFNFLLKIFPQIQQISIKNAEGSYFKLLNNYFCVSLLFIGLIILLFLAINKKDIPFKEHKFLLFLSFCVFLFIISLELSTGSSYYGARFLSLFYPIYVIVITTAVYFIANILIREKTYKFIILFAVIILISFLQKDNLLSIINRNYGDKFPYFLGFPNELVRIRGDYKTTTDYILKNAKEEDLIVGMGGYQNPTASIISNPDYIILSYYDTDTFTYIKNGLRYTKQSVTPVKVITNTQELQYIIDYSAQTNTALWIVTNETIEMPSHVFSNFKELLQLYKDKIIYESPDGISKIYNF